MIENEVKFSIPAGKVKSYAMDENTTADFLSCLGINASDNALKSAMDAAQAGVTEGSVSTSIQFLQHWLADSVEVITQARVIDDLVGRDIAGSWEDEEIVLTVKERLTASRLYGDDNSTHHSSWNTNFERRSIVRFEDGLQVGALEEARASKMRINSAAEKRAAVAEGFGINLNDVGFNGYNSGANRTYGILNDPNLSAYVTVAQGAGGATEWTGKTYNEIFNDIKAAMSALRVQSGSNFNPYKDACRLGIAADKIDYLATQNELGSQSVAEAIKKTFPNCEIVAVPQFAGANGGSDVFYLMAETLGGKRVVRQCVQDTLRLLGVEKTAKGFEEAYSCATAGVIVAQPVGIVRYSGI